MYKAKYSAAKERGAEKKEMSGESVNEILHNLKRQYQAWQSIYVLIYTPAGALVYDDFLYSKEHRSFI